MPSFSKTFLATVAITGAAASSEQYLTQRDFLNSYQNDLVTREEAEDLLELYTRDIDVDEIQWKRDTIEDELETALAARAESDHLDDLYARDLELRNFQIRSDLNFLFNNHDDLHTRSIELQDATLRIQELQRRDPELLDLFRRGSKLTGLMTGVAGAALAGKGNRMKGFIGGGAAGFFGHKLIHHFKNKKSGKREISDDDDDSHSDQYRRDLEDPDLWDY